MNSLVDRIEQAIKHKGTTFNRVEHDCGFGGGTIKRWMRQSPRFDKLVAVAQYLWVSLDYLAFGDESSLCHPNGEDSSEMVVSAKEMELLRKIRQLTEYQQEELFDLVDFKYQRIANSPKGLSYTSSLSKTNNCETA